MVTVLIDGAAALRVRMWSMVITGGIGMSERTSARLACVAIAVGQVSSMPRLVLAVGATFVPVAALAGLLLAVLSRRILMSIVWRVPGDRHSGDPAELVLRREADRSG
jgi:hypothetical protein